MLLALVAFVTGAAGVCAWTWMIVVRLKCPRCRRRESVIRIAGSWIWPRCYCVDCRREW
jgi:hypothetical protein